MLNGTEEILLPNLRVLPTLFPLLSSKLRGEMPCLKVCLRANMSTLDYIMGEEQVREMLRQEADVQEAA